MRSLETRNLSAEYRSSRICSCVGMKRQLYKARNHLPATSFWVGMIAKSISDMILSALESPVLYYFVRIYNSSALSGRQVEEISTSSKGRRMYPLHPCFRAHDVCGFLFFSPSITLMLHLVEDGACLRAFDNVNRHRHHLVGSWYRCLRPRKTSIEFES